MGVFSTSWDDDGGKSIEAVRQTLAHASIPLGADVAVGIAGHNTRLVGQPLAGGAHWTFAHSVDAAPILTGGLVIASGDGELFALDALTGKLLWRRPTGGLALRGAGDDGTVTVATLTGPLGQGSTLMAIAHDGSVLRQIERRVDFGSPAVVSRLAFVPWNNQYVSVVDVTDGAEVGRLLVREKTSRAWLSGGSLFFGELGIYRFDDKIKDASRGGADHLALPAKVLPGRPLAFRPIDDPAKAVAGAADKIRLFARPTSLEEPQPLAFDSGRFYATYFRLVFGLSADQEKLAWVHTHGSAVIGGAAAVGAVVICDADGNVSTLASSNGAQLGSPLAMGEPLESCVVQADGLRTQAVVVEPGTLVQQIQLALSDRDLELDAGQRWLLRALAGFQDEAGTDLLVRLATDSRLSPGMLEDVRALVAGRRTGARYLEEALDHHYDFLHDSLVRPPVGPIALALAGMKDVHATAALVRHLFDPADSDQDVRDVAQALAVLAQPGDAPALLHFFALYHDAPPEPVAMAQAVNAVAEALLRVGGAEGKAAISAAIVHSGTNAVVRAKLSALLDAESLQRGTPSMTPSSTSRE